MFPAPFPCFLDANVLYPFTLRDTLLRCAERDLYQPFWSEQVLDEAIRNLIKSGRMDEQKAAHLTAQMRLTFPEAFVENYDDLIPACGTILRIGTSRRRR